MTAQPPGNIRVTDDGRGDVRGTAVRVVFGALRHMNSWPTAADAFLHAAAAEGVRGPAVWKLIDQAMTEAVGHTRACLPDMSWDNQREVLRRTGDRLTAQIEPDHRGGAL